MVLCYTTGETPIKVGEFPLPDLERPGKLLPIVPRVDRAFFRSCLDRVCGEEREQRGLGLSTTKRLVSAIYSRHYLPLRPKVLTSTLRGGYINGAIDSMAEQMAANTKTMWASFTKPALPQLCRSCLHHDAGYKDKVDRVLHELLWGGYQDENPRLKEVAKHLQGIRDSRD
jgi:hypothetical protein